MYLNKTAQSSKTLVICSEIFHGFFSPTKNISNILHLSQKQTILEIIHLLKTSIGRFNSHEIATY